jgi:CheY-like chemotaxis protein
MTTAKSVLVIDDDDDIRALLALLLESAGYDVDALDDGIAALELKKKYDAILLDLNMPVFDGEQLTSYWVLTHPEVLRRVIVLTGYSGYTRGRSLPSTFASLPKPIDYRELLRLVEDCASQ